MCRQHVLLGHSGQMGPGQLGVPSHFSSLQGGEGKVWGECEAECGQQLPDAGQFAKSRSGCGQAGRAENGLQGLLREVSLHDTRPLQQAAQSRKTGRLRWTAWQLCAWPGLPGGLPAHGWLVLMQNSSLP